MIVMRIRDACCRWYGRWHPGRPLNLGLQAVHRVHPRECVCVINARGRLDAHGQQSVGLANPIPDGDVLKPGP